MGHPLLLFLLLSYVSGSVDYGKYLKVGNPDDTAIIERPCPVYDLNCIRKFFSTHAHCTETFGPAPDPLIRPQENLYLPRTNMSVTLPRQVIQGLNGMIEDFYVNKDTNNVVFVVDFRNFTVSSGTSMSYFQFHRRAKEPVVTTASALVIYQSAVITAVIPNILDMRLDEAECTTFVNDAVPLTVISPSIAESNDPQVQEAVASFMSNIGVDAQELFLTDSAYYIAIFIQYNICDFGLYVV